MARFPAGRVAFNPRTRAGCDAHYPLCPPISVPAFNPRTRAGCDLRGSLTKRGGGGFQSTPPRGVRHGFALRPSRVPAFQSTHPRGVRRHVTGSTAPVSATFNPRTRAGCDTGRRAARSFRCRLSIHAPARGATNKRPGLFTSPTDFQSTHPRGVRHSNGTSNSCLIFFQSTHPRGVRRSGIVRSTSTCKSFQSTHPRGVRPCRSALSGIGAPRAFNPRTRAGCDVRSKIRSAKVSIFQSTHPRGVRRVRGWSAA